MTNDFSIGQRVRVRGEVFRVTAVNNSVLSCEGISSLVRFRAMQFNTKYDTIEPSRPQDTRLLSDTSLAGTRTRLTIEAAFRQLPLATDKIVLGHLAAIDVKPYQLQPARKALEQEQQRILIADAVGLGKTVEVGILLSELMQRGRARRILVVALKSILEQFQKELWNRFAIALIRLDSEGIKRIRASIPRNQNPFDYHEKAIVSIDTLKQPDFYNNIEQSHWDVVVIDECHLVSNTGSSQRGMLAMKLARHCDALILTSATPHNGKKEMFANLVSMLDPIALPYGVKPARDVIEPLYIRRFKKDVGSEAAADFPEREIKKWSVRYGAAEQKVLEALRRHLHEEAVLMEVKRKSGGKTQRRVSQSLQSFSLLKAFLSTPAALVDELSRKRNAVVDYTDLREAVSAAYGEAKTDREDSEAPYKQYTAFAAAVAPRDARLQALIDRLQKIGWPGNQERIVIFTERLASTKYIAAALYNTFRFDGDKREWKSTDSPVVIFDGSLPDTTQQDLINNFGLSGNRILAMITTDAAAAGVNLHHRCHIMFNYDLPWSLITLVQRNGRIDRYGQKQTPIINYLIAQDEEGSADFIILDKLLEKEQEVVNTLGEASRVLGLREAEQEEALLANAAATNDVGIFEEIKEQGEGNKEHSSYSEALGDCEEEEDWFEFINDGSMELRETSAPSQPINEATQPLPTLYPTAHGRLPDDDSFYTSLLDALRQDGALPGAAYQVEKRGSSPTYCVLLSGNLSSVRELLPSEVRPESNGAVELTCNRAVAQRYIEEARDAKLGGWSKEQLLWDLHPLARYLLMRLGSKENVETAYCLERGDLGLDGRAAFIAYASYSDAHGATWLGQYFVAEADEHAVKVVTYDEFVKSHPMWVSGWSSSRPLAPEAVSRLEGWRGRVVEAVEEAVRNLGKTLLATKQQQRDAYQKRLDLYAASIQGTGNKERGTVNERRAMRMEQALKQAKGITATFDAGIDALKNREPFIKIVALVVEQSLVVSR